MDQKLLEFINKYLNIPNVGDTDANKGQCVGLIEVWTDSLGLPHTWGDAKDLPANADPNYFDIINNDINDTTQFPIPGDILVYGPTWGAGVGHTGIIVDATGTSIVIFEQNNPVGHAPEVATRNSYIGVTHWLHPKTTPLPSPIVPKFNDQTKIPKELLGEDQDLEIQQIRGLLLDGKRDNFDLANCRKENEKLENYLAECQQKLSATTPISPSKPLKTALGRFFYQLAMNIG